SNRTKLVSAHLVRPVCCSDMINVQRTSHAFQQPRSKTMKTKPVRHRQLLATLSITWIATVPVAFAQQFPAPRQLSAAPRHLAIAEALIANLDLSNTNYEHGAGTVKFTTPCESHTDCSGFIDALFKQTYGYDKEQYKKWLGANRPTAHQYHDAIEQEKGF